MKKKDLCKITIPAEQGFLGIGNSEAYSYHEHSWIYSSTTRRKCKKCGQKELFFDTYDNTYTPWRPMN
jgi:hypothetical protein